MAWYSSPLQQLLIALSLCQIVVNAASIADFSLRQRQASTQPGTMVTCLDYSTIANLSTIGLNATYRAAYLQAAPDGTAHSAAILDGAEDKIPPLTMNAELNQQCGNLTTVALVEAANNFTQGVVAQYRINAGMRNRGGLGLVMAACLVTVGMLVVM